MAAYLLKSEIGAYGVATQALAAVSAVDQDRAIDGASDLIDSYLRGRYRLPLVAWGTDIRRTCAVIVAYDLISARGYNPADPGDEQLRLRYEDAIAWLKGIASGSVHPEITDSSSGAVTGRPAPLVGVSSNVSRGWQDTLGEAPGAFGGRR